MHHACLLAALYHAPCCACSVKYCDRPWLCMCEQVAVALHSVRTLIGHLEKTRRRACRPMTPPPCSRISINPFVACVCVCCNRQHRTYSRRVSIITAKFIDQTLYTHTRRGADRQPCKRYSWRRLPSAAATYRHCSLIQSGGQHMLCQHVERVYFTDCCTKRYQ
jgi:hypothetical protein